MVIVRIKWIYWCKVPRIVLNRWKVFKGVSSYYVCFQGRHILLNIRLDKYIKVGKYERKIIFLNLTDTSLKYLPKLTNHDFTVFYPDKSCFYDFPTRK